jgi:hypothetical protein
VAGLRKCKILKSQRILINAVNINWFVKLNVRTNFTIRHLGSYVATFGDFVKPEIDIIRRWERGKEGSKARLG